MTSATDQQAAQLSATPGDTGARRAGLAQLASPGLSLWLFAMTLFTSALLLFAVQPMFAKMALPKLGGAPSVWAVSMCFFQVMLLAGYCYAHLLIRFVPTALAVILHVSLLIVTLMALPISLPASLGDPPQGDAYLWLISVLALGVGLPFFAVSANAPLLQAWFARTGHPAARDPYFLYGASNVGSLLALLAYPLVVEPLLGAQAQSRLWSRGFMLLATLIAISGVAMLLLQMNRRGEVTAAADEPSTIVSPTWRTRGIWVLLAAVPSGLMVAVTTYITTDLASAPFLWVLPLAMFLATFVLVFKDKVSRHFDLIAVVLPATVMAGVVAPGRALGMMLALASFFMAALACHRELYLQRPPARHLTAFYLWMSAGGVIGGVFAALLSPKLFTSTYEFNALLAASLLCVPGLIFRAREHLDTKRIIGLVCLMLAVVMAQSIALDLGGPAAQRIAMALAIVGLVITLYRTREWAERNIIFMLGLALMLLGAPETFQALSAERSFFGTVRVIQSADGQHRFMLNGTTLHGVRRIKTEAGADVATPHPASYYHPNAPMARAVDVVRRAKTAATTAAGGGADASARILAGVVGLGTGSLACYAQPGDAFRFYEIDPVVVKAATNPRLFDFLATCTPKAPIVVGDARLTLAKEPDEVFDYLVIDAFSSDSVPIHLITVEALKLYLSKLSETGLLALHVSNHFMDLPGAVASTIAEIPGVQAAIVRYTPRKNDLDANASAVIMLARSSKVLDEVLTWPDAEGLPRTSIRPWTDDYANVAGAILRQLSK